MYVELVNNKIVEALTNKGHDPVSLNRLEVPRRLLGNFGEHCCSGKIVREGDGF